MAASSMRRRIVPGPRRTRHGRLTARGFARTCAAMLRRRDTLRLPDLCRRCRPGCMRRVATETAAAPSVHGAPRITRAMSAPTTSCSAPSAWSARRIATAATRRSAASIAVVWSITCFATSPESSCRARRATISEIDAPQVKRGQLESGDLVFFRATPTRQPRRHLCRPTVASCTRRTKAARCAWTIWIRRTGTSTSAAQCACCCSSARYFPGLSGAVRRLSSSGAVGRWITRKSLPATWWQPVHAADRPS